MSNQNLPLTVSQISDRLKKIIEPNFFNVYITGEITNYKGVHSSGHYYFSLKDAKSTIKCVFFKFNADRHKNLDEILQEGKEIIVKGRITVYSASGNYQINIRQVELVGQGSLRKKYELLRKKLEKEGLFDRLHKKPLPEYPETIGIVTSEDSAAIKDIYNTIERRYPLVRLLLYPVKVEGKTAAEEIVQGIKYFNNIKPVDIIIVGRGGGSYESMWPFNEEKVARAVFDCKIPVISAVGHERDWFISDEVADKRAPTPTGAGEIAVPSAFEKMKLIQAHLIKIKSYCMEKIKNYNELLNLIKKRHVLRSPFGWIENREQTLSVFYDKILERYKNLLINKNNKISRYENLNILLKNNYSDKVQKLKTNINDIKNKVPPIYLVKNNEFKTLESRIENNIFLYLKEKQQKIENAKRKLKILSYKNTLKRGFAIVEKNKKIVKSADNIKIDDNINIKLYRGDLECQVKKKR